MKNFEVRTSYESGIVFLMSLDLFITIVDAFIQQKIDLIEQLVLPLY